jgi:hypothetical protein
MAKQNWADEAASGLDSQVEPGNRKGTVGKGGGVRSAEELKGIRKTGNFPDDAVWHHDPTVANRPDLAADSLMVHPMRGGPKAHLCYGHDMNWRNPKE